MRLAVLLRKNQRRVGMADEHDAERITAYCRRLDGIYGVQWDAVKPDERAAAVKAGRHDGYLFIGAEDGVREVVRQACAQGPTFLWGKAYRLMLDPQWATVLDRLRLLFTSCYLGGIEHCYNERTQYLPTAFHHEWPVTWRDRLQDVAERRIDIRRFDVVFSGSGRMHRTDQYRERLLNLLAARGLHVAVAAPRHVWQWTQGRNVPLDRRIALLGTWGGERLFAKARCVLDLPWLDTVFASHPPHQDPNHSIWALGWNIFRAGAFGAHVLTYDCAANRELGLDEGNCVFYHANLCDLNALADEITEQVQAMRDDRAASERRLRLMALFHARHRYIDRWEQLYREITQAIVHDRATVAAG